MVKAIKFVFKEHYDNRHTIRQMSMAHAKKQTIRTSLGLGWVFIRDMIYFTAYILFRFFMSGSGEMEGMHFMLFLITGLVPWFFMNEVINGGCMAIKANGGIIKSVKFPITIIPTYEVFAVYLKRLFTFLIPFVVMGLVGSVSTFNPILFIYYSICMVTLMIILNLVTSAFVAISEDFNQLYHSITSVLFFLMPIMWSYEYLSSYRVAQIVLKLNPMVYVIDGFRNAYVLGNYPSIKYTVFFWGMCLILLIIGSISQYRLRKLYSDFI